jgi:hypothetical protein
MVERDTRMLYKLGENIRVGIFILLLCGVMSNTSGKQYILNFSISDK